jgi:hypothetical protein
MHAEIDQKHEELRQKLDQFDRQIEENKDYWRLFLRTQMEIKVGCVLTEQLQKYEIDALEFNKAHQEFIRVQKLFHLLNNQPLISVRDSEGKQINLNSTHLYFPSITSDGLDWMKIAFSEKRIKCLDEQQTHSNQDSSCETSSGIFLWKIDITIFI